ISPENNKPATDAELLAASPLFDADWYLRSYPDVAAAGVDPAIHYLSSGAAEGRDPGPRFSTQTYLRLPPIVAGSGENPLLHYIRPGLSYSHLISPQNNKPATDAALLAASALFDRGWYLKTYPDVAAAGVDPAIHYLSSGAAEGRDPGPRF